MATTSASLCGVCHGGGEAGECAHRHVGYAMEAVKQGSAAVGLRSTTHDVFPNSPHSIPCPSPRVRSALLPPSSPPGGVEYAMQEVKQGSVAVEYAMEAVKQGSAVVGLRSTTHEVEYAMEAVKKGNAAVEYAMEAVKQGSAAVGYTIEVMKQGSAAVGLHSTTHAVLATLKRAASPLASYQRKIFRVDDHMGIAIAGLNADGRVLCRFMRSECLSHKFDFESPLPVGRLDSMVADKSQAAKTYLERKFESFGACSLDELVRHALLAVKESLQEGELSGANCTVSNVGEGQAFSILTDVQVQEHIDRMDKEEGGQGGAVKDEVEVVEEVEVEDVEEEKPGGGEGGEGGTGEGSEGPALEGLDS
ncbi:unnamed protein product [Closterium sp. Naga37s-1]|nr:unnamed protein product [Closterium sp. Naga37s-1]